MVCRSKHTLAFLREYVPSFTQPNFWPPNSPQLNPSDYAVLGALQQLVYRQKIQDIERLKEVLRSLNTEKKHLEHKNTITQNIHRLMTFWSPLTTCGLEMQ